METTLHRQLKEHYADSEAIVEAPVEAYRIDVLSGDWLIEIQHAGLSAIVRKVQDLVERHQVLVVKPLILRKRLVRQKKKDGAVISRRLSPKRGGVLDLFEELVHFTQVFPHPNLVLETPLVEIEEWRYPGHGRRRRRRKDDFQVADRKLVSVEQTHRFSTAADLLTLLPETPSGPFHTGHLADMLGISRWAAQKIAYCLRQTGAVNVVGKDGNAWLYEAVSPPKPTGERLPVVA
ncbi:hypothetical protein [Lignipirellula cremea]|uniref:DUF8091 domain-containing protein n=1 Tax=Lignipirellula cremea TaxID=2528010 RepID=A0A518E0J0_9BACT|nr:hypothetical protein [Lignipirellula cremea]QDU97608.1 hypothetical protein Pla8534_54580 [Lignipirellula cremea]